METSYEQKTENNTLTVFLEGRIWNVFIRTYLDTDDEEIITKAEQQIEATSLARRLFMVIAIPGSLTPETLAAMKQRLFSLCDIGLGDMCF